jgi:hypothetical protein
MQRLEDTSTSYNVGMAMIGYSLCSSSLLLANKVQTTPSFSHLLSPSSRPLMHILA